MEKDPLQYPHFLRRSEKLASQREAAKGTLIEAVKEKKWNKALCYYWRIDEKGRQEVKRHLPYYPKGEKRADSTSRPMGLLQRKSEELSTR